MSPSRVIAVLESGVAEGAIPMAGPGFLCALCRENQDPFR